MLALCCSLRETTRIPVILLTAMGEETDRIVGLDVGADDYVAKPFNPREPLARIRAVLRRAQSLPPDREPLPAGTYRFDRWSLDAGRRELVDETSVVTPLSSGELRLLVGLLERPGMVLSRDQLLDLIRGGATFVLTFLLSALGIAVVAVLTGRRIAKPMRSLAGAAGRLGRGEAVDSLSEAGPV